MFKNQNVTPPGPSLDGFRANKLKAKKTRLAISKATKTGTSIFDFSLIFIRFTS